MVLYFDSKQYISNFFEVLNPTIGFNPYPEVLVNDWLIKMHFLPYKAETKTSLKMQSCSLINVSQLFKLQVEITSKSQHLHNELWLGLCNNKFYCTQGDKGSISPKTVCKCEKIKFQLKPIFTWHLLCPECCYCAINTFWSNVHMVKTIRILPFEPSFTTL